MNAQNSGENSDELVPQPHGGALLPRGKRGNAGGGRPRDVIREAYLNLLTEHGVEFLRDVIKARTTIQLREACEYCGKEPTRRKAVMSTDVLEMIPSTESRLRAVDIASRYGLGGRDEITVVSADVQDRLARQAEAIMEVCPREIGIKLVTRLREVWT